MGWNQCTPNDNKTMANKAKRLLTEQKKKLQKLIAILLRDLCSKIKLRKHIFQRRNLRNYSVSF